MPQYSRAQVTDSRGTAFGALGYTIRRPNYTEKRLELLPEEALYLVERGSMLCWNEGQVIPMSTLGDERDPIKIIGEPMSVQQCFMTMLGVENLTMEHYQVSILCCYRFWPDISQVYAYLKRFGYTVRRAHSLPSTKEYTVYHHPRQPTSPTVLIKHLFSRLYNSLQAFFINPWHRFRPTVISYFRRDVHYRQSGFYL
jgi:tRNA-splicing endonuclease subunit Sen54